MTIMTNSTIMVQNMNPIPTGKQKKYDPEKARDFVDFSKYSKLSLKNVKAACENFFANKQVHVMFCTVIEAHRVMTMLICRVKFNR